MRISKMGVLVVSAVMVSLVVFGCSKKAEQKTNLSALGLEGEDKDMVTQTATSTDQEAQNATQAAPQPIRVETKGQQAVPIQMQEPVQTMPAQLPGEEMDKGRQIQTALKNAGLYNGSIDGKIGPMTKKAVEEFQKMKGLKVDGKVGPMTWGELQKYLNAPAAVNEPVSQTAPAVSKTGR